METEGDETMSDEITYWRCRKCRRVGILAPYGLRCLRCDGTGNALVDGEAAAHQRAVKEALERQGEESPARRIGRIVGRTG